MLQTDQHVLEFVDDYLHELLAPADAAVVERHCADCRICQAALDEARLRRDALGSLPPCEASEQLIQTTLEKIQMTTQRRQHAWRVARRSVLSLAVAASLVIALTQVYFHRLEPSAPEIRVAGQRDWMAGTRAGMRVGLLDHFTGQPLTDVPVEIRLRNPRTSEQQTLVRFVSDGTGNSPAFQVPDWAEGHYELEVIAQPADGALEKLVRSVQLQRAWKLMLSTDKPIYQPGQTIHIRSLALRKPDLKPVAGQEVTFRIHDPKGNVIFKQSQSSSTFGIAATDCPLAVEILEGTYRLECRVGNVTSERTLEVQKYVLPKFQAQLQLDQPFYGPGDTVHGTLEAKYFFGQPVAGGKVILEVQTTDVEPQALGQLEFATDAEGKAPFQFALPPQLAGRPQDGGGARVKFVCQVTDTAGQSYTTDVSRLVTTQAIQVAVIPEGGTLVRDIPNKIYLYAAYADGRPAAAELVINGLETPLTTTALGLAVMELTPREPQVALTVRATDAQQRVGRTTLTLSTGVVSRDFLVRTDKAVYDGGQPLNVSILGGGSEPVFIDLIKDGQTMLTQTIDVRQGLGQATLDLPAELSGTLNLVAYRFDANGLAVRKERLLFVRQADRVAIQTESDRESYRPGDTARLRLQLTDAQGKPRPGAISLAIVDEAVFSVMLGAGGLESTFFLLDQELLEPVYAIYNWAPDLSTSLGDDERNLLEQALFSRTAVSGAGQDWQGTPASGGVASAEPRADSAAAGHPLTLVANSFLEKAARVQQTRARGLEVVWTAWLTLAGFLVLALLAAFAVAMPRTFCLAAAVATVLAFVAFLMLLSRPLARMAGVAPDAAAAKFDFQEGAPPLLAAVESAPGKEPAGAALRIRQWFPETLLWQPELITDDQGQATVEVNLADSITSWRVSASAVTADGQLGNTQSALRVFQPFFVDLNLPVTLTRGDEVALPVVVYNYLDTPQTVAVELQRGEWFELLPTGGADVDRATLELAPGEVRVQHFPIRVRQVGRYQLEVTAQSGALGDAVRREIEIMPNGRPVEQVVSGSLREPVDFAVQVPQEAVPGSVRALVRLYPSTFSQLVEGLDAIFRMPYGCFEQTSSTTYPNVLALEYLKRTQTSSPEVEAKARQYIQLGYQRLVAFEVPGGGFDWFGRPPANRILTAYGLMEFQDMARVTDVDPLLIDRTRAWLLAQRRADGAWPADQAALHEQLAGNAADARLQELLTTAYIAWSVFGGSGPRDGAQVTLDYLLRHAPGTIEDPYVLAVMINAVAAIQPDQPQLPAYLARLDALRRSSADGKLVWWEQRADQSTPFYGSGQAGHIETTAMATLACLATRHAGGSTAAALAWLVTQKDASGTWHSTQATILALKALVAATDGLGASDTARKFEIQLQGETIRTLDVPPEQNEVVQQVDLSSLVTSGENRFSIRELSDTATTYQIVFRYHDERPVESPDAVEPLTVKLAYDRQQLAVNDHVVATAIITNHMPQTAPMVILDLPIPGGFVIQPEELDELLGAGQIARYQITPRKAIVYLRGLEAGASLELRYRLKATMPVRVAVPPAQAYEYYNPSRRGAGSTVELEVIQS